MHAGSACQRKHAMPDSSHAQSWRAHSSYWSPSTGSEHSHALPQVSLTQSVVGGEPAMRFCNDTRSELRRNQILKRLVRTEKNHVRITVDRKAVEDWLDSIPAHCDSASDVAGISPRDVAITSQEPLPQVPIDPGLATGHSTSSSCVFRPGTCQA